jgi:CelD/BcsL family acetyltransferase involved in cellulose biosynthesis
MPTRNATGTPTRRGSIDTGWIRTSTPPIARKHDLQMLGPVIKTRRLPPAAGPAYRALRQPISRCNQIHQHEQWRHHGQRRKPDAEQLRADHRHFDGIYVRQIAIAHDGVRNGKRRPCANRNPMS